MHHEAASFWSPESVSMQEHEVVATGYHDLDVRTCTASWRRRAPVGPERDGSDIPLAERGMMGTVRFYAGDDKTSLMAVNTATGQKWTAATGFTQVYSVIAVPAARRILVTTPGELIYAYDVDANRVVSCR